MENLVEADGYFYDKEGVHLGQMGTSTKVYLCNKYEKTAVIDPKRKEKITIIKYLDNIDLHITHEQFCYIAGIIKAEEASTFEGAAATTQATYNAVKYIKGNDLTMAQQSEYARKLLAIDGVGSYSTVKPKEKKPLEDKDSDQQSRNARKGLIHVLTKGKDYSEGAIRWDGIDFADEGINHAKAKNDGISITYTLWVKFVNACEYKPDSNGVLKLNRHKTPEGRLAHKTKEEALATIPFKSIKEPPKERVKPIPSIDIFGFNRYNQSDFVEDKNESTIEIYETEGSGKYNTGRVLNLATVVCGRHIFWKTHKKHSKNEGYYWPTFLGSKI